MEDTPAVAQAVQHSAGQASAGTPHVALRGSFMLTAPEGHAHAVERPLSTLAAQVNHIVEAGLVVRREGFHFRALQQIRRALQC